MQHWITLIPCNRSIKLVGQPLQRTQPADTPAEYEPSRYTLGKRLYVLPRFETPQDRSEISPDSEETYGVLETNSLNQKTYGKLGFKSENGRFLAVLLNA